jgi:L-threonylcarbamoyladenylate synthase
MSETKIYQASKPEDVLWVTRILREGGLAVIPTDTVYGLAASIFQPQAINRVYQIKRRQPDAAVPVLMATAADIPLVARAVPAVAWRLIDEFWPGPLTLVLAARQNLRPELTGGGTTIGVRVPGSRSCLRLLQALGEPVVGTSANISGDPPAMTAPEAHDRLGEQVDAILEDDASVTLGTSSTVLELTDREATVHRVGAISAEDLRRILGSSVRIHHRLTSV